MECRGKVWAKKVQWRLCPSTYFEQTIDEDGQQRQERFGQGQASDASEPGGSPFFFFFFSWWLVSFV